MSDDEVQVSASEKAQLKDNQAEVNIQEESQLVAKDKVSNKTLMAEANKKEEESRL